MHKTQNRRLVRKKSLQAPPLLLQTPHNHFLWQKPNQRQTSPTFQDYQYLAFLNSLSIPGFPGWQILHTIQAYTSISNTFSTPPQIPVTCSKNFLLWMKIFLAQNTIFMEASCLTPSPLFYKVAGLTLDLQTCISRTMKLPERKFSKNAWKPTPLPPWMHWRCACIPEMPILVKQVCRAMLKPCQSRCFQTCQPAEPR